MSGATCSCAAVTGLQVALMVQLLTDGGPPALVSAAIIDALAEGAAARGSDSVLLSADLIQRAGRHAMLLFVYARLPRRSYCFSPACTIAALAPIFFFPALLGVFPPSLSPHCSLSDLAASLSTADAALRIMIVAAVQTGLQAIGLQVEPPPAIPCRGLLFVLTLLPPLAVAPLARPSLAFLPMSNSSFIAISPHVAAQP
jgi:hypothetical protein